MSQRTLFDLPEAAQPAARQDGASGALAGLVGASLAGELLARYGSLRGVVMDLPSLERRRPAVWRKLRAAVDFGAMLARDGASGARFSAPAETARYLMPSYSARPVEVFGVLALDVRHRLVREEVVSVGCLTASLVHPREVFKVALDARAASLVLFHNHPSGDPEPSAEDIALTRRLAAAGTLMGVEVLDHLVLGAGRYVSLKERGVL
jgi:DNA repair protein RadC